MKKPEKQMFNDNGCSYFQKCVVEEWKALGDCCCYNPVYYLGKLKEQCPVLAAKRERYATLLALELALPKNIRITTEQAIPKKNVGVAEVYLEIFNSFQKDPLDDNAIADRILARTGVRPDAKHISSYRCMYNTGNINGQTAAPEVQVERIKGRFKKGEVAMVKVKAVKKAKQAGGKPKVSKPAGEETKEGKLVKLLKDGKFHNLAEIIKVTGFAEASANMYVSQGYLDRKGKPYKVEVEEKGKVKSYRYKA